MKPIVRVSNLSKLYRVGKPLYVRPSVHDAMASAVKRITRRNGDPEATFWALKDVSFEAQAGEVIGIIGRNGAGKSTLLRILARITKPTSGEADIYGRLGTLLEIGTGFHPDLTGRENIFLNGAILGMRAHEIRSKFDEIVAFSEVERFLETPVKHYSAGMYLRLAFSVAAHFEPEVLLLDEVIAVGDIAFQKKCFAKIKDATQQGRTIFMVSHNLDSIKSLCQRVLWLSQGRLCEERDVATTIADYTAAARA